MVRFEIYPERDEQGYITNQWRWRARSGNNQITAGSQESFPSKHNAMRAAMRFTRSVLNAFQGDGLNIDYAND